jgi:hypothetical protein
LLLSLGVLALAVRFLIALPVREPGYFDAYYYYHVAQNMLAGRGMIETVVWNYLDQSSVAMQLPHPSHLYWMPLTTWIAWIGMRLGGALLGQFHAALVPFILLSALLPPFSGWVAWHLWQRADFALWAGMLTLFSGFYFLYWIVPDNYTPFTLAVSLSLVGCWLGGRGRSLGWALAGMGAGLSHLSRADGVLLVPAVALLAVYAAIRSPLAAAQRHRQAGLRTRLSFLLVAGILAAGGYLAVFGPWLLRNLAVAGTLLPGGGLKTLWLRSYDELFSYQTPLTPQRLLSWGLWPIVRSRVEAVVWNSVVVLGALQFFLAPFAWLGFRQLRPSPGKTGSDNRIALFRPVLLYTSLLFLAMSLVFAFPSRRGSMLHSTAALVPWLMALVPAGIESAAIRFARWRGRDPAPAARFFGVGFVALAALVSVWLYAQVLFLPPAPGATMGPWNERAAHYRAVERWLAREGAVGPVLVVDPPAFAVTTGRPAIVVPTDGFDALQAVADRFGARWLIVESDHAAPYATAWKDALPPPGWEHAADFEDSLGAPVRLFVRAAP